MFPFFGWLPLLVVLLIVFALWSVYEQWRFTRFDGPIRRGITIDSAPLDWDTRQFLETMPLEWRDGRAFIRKEINEVLISADPSTWQRFFGRRRQLEYVAYVNLSAPESRIEFRAPLAGLAMMVVGLIAIAGFVIYIFYDLPPGATPWCFLLWPAFIFAIFIGSFIYNHYRQRRLLLGVLSQARGQASPGAGYVPGP